MVARALPSVGVTAFQPTYITNPIPALVAGLRRLRPCGTASTNGDGGAHALGVHLEGPFLSPASAAACTTSRFMVEPDDDNLDALARRSRRDRTDHHADAGTRTSVALSKRSEGSPRWHRGVGRPLRRHRRAGARRGLAGARMVTHIFNAQRGFDHREAWRVRPGSLRAGGDHRLDRRLRTCLRGSVRDHAERGARPGRARHRCGRRRRHAAGHLRTRRPADRGV